jgi:hypothetical protein
MTTRNFRVRNGLSVGDIVINAATNQITGISTSAPSADGDVVVKGYLDTRLSALSSNSLTQLNSSATVTDSGTNGTFTVVADGGNVLVQTSADTTITASSNINLTATADVVIPSNVGITFGDAGEKIEGNGTDLTITSSGLLNLSATNDVVVSGNMRVIGNFEVEGTETIINTTSIQVEDNIIGLNRTASGNATIPRFSGIHINRGDLSTATENDLYWVWDEQFADDGSSIFGNAGGAWTALRATHNEGEQSPNSDFSLVDIRANVVHALSTSAQYADLAERFAADAPIAEGAVVMLGGSQEITETYSELSDEVFGVVSTRPAYAMNAGAGNNESHPFVAMSGRIPVRVIGPVTKGQRLVTSAVKGTARAVSNTDTINPFHVIGRALEDKHDDAIGMVNCVVRTNN